MYRKELEHIECWVKANKLDQLDFSRQKQAYCYFSAAATLFPPEMSDARICWAKNSVLTTVVDDFFDIGGTKEELVNFVTLVKKWDGNHEKEFCSERVRTVFSALYSTIHELGAKAWALQKRSITKHIIEIWLSLIESMMKEFDWQRNKLVPTLDEYMRNAYISFALGPIVLPSLYFVGPELSEDIIRNPEYHKLYYLMSTCGRLLNNIQGSEPGRWKTMQVVCGTLVNSNFKLLSHQSSSMNTIRAACSHGLKINASVSIPVQHAIGAKDRIRESLQKVEFSVSSYDTAWVAMVPSPRSLELPCFPECVDWILDNQHPNGSWGHLHTHPSLTKDTLSSTLACILALRTWNVGEEHVKKGLQYIGSNLSSTVNIKMLTPIGFDIIFPSMICHALEMGLDLPMNKNKIDTLRQIRDLELKKGFGDYTEGTKAYHAYLAEGLRESQNWKQVMMFQKKNGSLFNSPSATAAALIHTQDEKSLNYLCSLVQKFGSAVPTIYPLDIFTHLSIVDKLERFGISRHFSSDIKNIMDMVYRCWVEKDEEIFSDIATSAMAFRILQMNGYDVSSDELASFDEVDGFNNSVRGHLRDMTTVLELFKASQIRISENDKTLQKLNSWSKSYLKEELSTGVIQHPNAFLGEVDYFLNYPFYVKWDRLEHKWAIEHCNMESFHLLKTSYSNCIVSNKDLVEVAVEDFNLSQSMYRKELEHIESWVKANKLDQIEFARQKQIYVYVCAAATLFSPELADARICRTKCCVLGTVLDDFFDIGGSREEQENLIALVKKWDGNHEKEFYSVQVKIIFSAIYSTLNELGAKASAFQKRSVTDHIVENWLIYVESMMEEAKWLRNMSVPTMEEYMRAAHISFGIGAIIMATLYFVGPELSEDVVRSAECHRLYQLMSTCGRLINDMHTFEREEKQGKLNSVTLRIHHSRGSTSVEEAKREIESEIDSGRTQLLKLVLRSEGSVVPRACKDAFWAMHKTINLFYMRTDGFTSPQEMLAYVRAVIHEPLRVGHLHLSENA